MFGIFLTFVGTFFQEFSDSLGKKKVEAKEESLYTMGFLIFFFSFLFFLLISFFRGEFLFSVSSLPTFVPKLFLEVLQAHVTIWAIVTADRTTFSFIRTLTIPLLLFVDVVLGYSISTFQFIGISLIFIVVILIFLNNKMKKKGRWLVLFTAVNAVATLSLFKYNITYFNSVEAEQSITIFVLLIYFFIMAMVRKKENPFVFLKKPIFFFQSLSSGLSTVFASFAFLFAPASVIIAAKRSFSISWSLLSGYVYFKERTILTKIIFLLLLVIGVILMIF